MKIDAKVGDLVLATFHDHGKSDDQHSIEEALEFYAMGVLVKVNNKEMVLRSWGYTNKPYAPSDDNTHQWIIARKALVGCRPLLRASEWLATMPAKEF